MHTWSRISCGTKYLLHIHILANFIYSCYSSTNNWIQKLAFLFELDDWICEKKKIGVYKFINPTTKLRNINILIRETDTIIYKSKPTGGEFIVEYLALN